MWLRPQIVSAERTAVGFPQAWASSDSAALVSAADSTGDSAAESVTKERYNPCASVSGHITEATRTRNEDHVAWQKTPARRSAPTM
jgi:hypothetical protein